MLAQACLRTAVLAGAVVALVLWPQPAFGYGWTFWLWLVSAGAYALSFTGAERKWQRPRPAVIVVLGVILVLAALLRFPRLEEIPGNIAIDEVYPGLEALRIARGEAPNVFSSVGWFNIPRLSFAYPALFMKVLDGDAFHALRLSSAVMGLAGIVATFLLGRRLLGDVPGLIAAFMMGVGFWHVHNSRTGFPFIQSSFAVALVLYLVLRARQDRSLLAMAVAGLCMGTALQGYFPLRSLLLLVPMLLTGSWFATGERLRRVVTEGVVLAGGAALAIGPLVRSVSLATLTHRSSSILIFREAVLQWLEQQYKTVGLARVLWANVREGAGMFVDWADVCILNRSPAGLLDGVTLGAAALAALMALMQGRGRLVFLVLWVGVVFVGGVALTDAPRASYRLAPAMPALYLLAGYGLNAALFATPRRPWLRLAVWPAVVVALAAWLTLTNYRLFFVQYSARGDGREFLLPGALRLVGRECDGRMFYWLAGEQARQSDLFELFCPNFRAIEETDIPAAIDRRRRATFIVMRPWQDALQRLEACYPKTRAAVHRTGDGRFLFMRVDAEVEDLVAVTPSCTQPARAEAGEPASRSRRPGSRREP